VLFRKVAKKNDNVYAYNRNTKARFSSYLRGCGPLCVCKEVVMSVAIAIGRFNNRDEYPYLNFSRLSEIKWGDVFAELGITKWLEFNRQYWTGRCPFRLHDIERKTFSADDATGSYYCSECPNTSRKSISDFVVRIFGFDKELKAEIWLLQFDPKQRELIDVQFGRDLQGMTLETRDRLETKYDPERYRERRLLKRLGQDLVEGKHGLLLELLAQTVQDDIVSIAQMSKVDLASYLQCSALGLAEKLIKKK
jgi:hypothetical protein